MKAILCYRCMHVVSVQPWSKCPCGNCSIVAGKSQVNNPSTVIHGYELDGYFVKDADMVEEILLSKVRHNIGLSSSETLFLMERGQNENSGRHFLKD